MTNNVVYFSGLARLNIPAERVLDSAKEVGMESVIIFGVTEDGEEYFASSQASGSEALWMLERARILLLEVVDE